MPEAVLTRERILEAAEDALRRYGPAKANVVDVARALGVSHGSVYRHFPTKAALRAAVTQRWLDRSHASMAGIATDARVAAPERLRRWLAALFTAKRKKALDDPELFATYVVLVGESDEVIAEHVAALVDEVATIIRDGVAAGEFAPVDDVQRAARAVFAATARFHDPVYAAEWSGPEIERDFYAVRDLVLSGLSLRKPK